VSRVNLSRLTLPHREAHDHQRDPTERGREIDIVADASRFPPPERGEYAEDLKRVRQRHHPETDKTESLESRSEVAPRKKQSQRNAKKDACREQCQKTLQDCCAHTCPVSLGDVDRNIPVFELPRRAAEAHILRLKWAHAYGARAVARPHGQFTRLSEHERKRDRLTAPR
jgi:hypothetical protein